MQYKKGHTLFQGFLLFSTIVMFTVQGLPQDTPTTTTTVKRGRYVPELFGAHLGKYTPDDSGKYNHIHRPYDGGYGDRGVKYIHDASGKLVRVNSNGMPSDADDLLGPRDHLRFMIDFNYDNDGWQIIKFDWLRDGDDNYKYQYVNENQLWNSGTGDLSSKEVEDASAGNEGDKTNDNSDAHIDGEYSESKGYNYSYSDDKANKNSKNLQHAIKEVLDYIEMNILPTL